MDLLALIKSRRTVRKFTDKKIPRKIIENLIDAGRWAPSAHNFQPWKVVIVEDENKISEIAALLEKKADDLLAGFNIVLRDTAKKLRGTPLLLIVYATGVIVKKYDKLEDPYAKIVNIFEIQSVANAIENILLYSYSIGLGAAWYGMALFCEKEINNLLGQKDRLMAIVSVGYPDEVPPQSSRKQMSQICEFVV